MDSDGYALIRAEGVFRADGFEEIAARNVGHFGERPVLLADIHAVRPHLHLVGDLVSAVVAVVEGEVNELGGGIEVHPQPLAHLAGYGVAHERLVAVVGEQRPFLCLGITLAKQLLLLVELELVGFLCQAPCSVASPAYLQRVVEGNVVVLIDIPHSGIDIGGLAVDASSVEGIDIDMREVGEPLHVLDGWIAWVWRIGCLFQSPNELWCEGIVGVGQAIVVGIVQDVPECVSSPRFVG